MRQPPNQRRAPVLDALQAQQINVIEGSQDASGLRVAVVATQWYEELLGRLVAGAVTTLRQHGLPEGHLQVLRAPGAFELPLVVDQLAASGRFDAIIALGCVIRGGTPHFEYVAGECARGLMEVSLKHGVPVGFGVLTCDTMAQAEERAAPGDGNKGREAALAVLQSANLLRRITHD